MNSFEFVLPTRIKFGAGVTKELAREINALNRKKPMIITDKGLIQAGVIDRVIQILDSEGFANYQIFDAIEPNPRDISVHKAYEMACRCQADILVAVGGGSAMDTAKAVGVLMEHGGCIGDFEGLDKVRRPIADLIAIPTTVGTGSEVTFWSVITDSKRHFKMSIGSPLVAPKLALVDPDLIQSLPAAIVAATGMDALTHAIEGYTCRAAEPITDACGIYAIKLIADNLRNAVHTDSEEARANMLLGSLIAGICFGNADIAGVHCMAEALGGLYDTPHGIANAILLPYVMEFNFTAALGKFAEIAKAMGERTEHLSTRDAAYQAVAAVKKLNSDINIPTLEAIGADAADLEELARRSAVNVSAVSNPKKVGVEEFRDIFKKALYCQ